MSKGFVPPLTDETGMLRPLESGDLATTLSWRNHPDSRQWFLSSNEIRPDEHQAWFLAYSQRDNDMVFILEFEGAAVAQVSLYNIAEDHAEFGRLLVDPTRRGRGHAGRAIGLCLRVAAERLNLRQVTLEVKRENIAAIQAYARAGFVETSRTEDGIIHMQKELS